LRLQLINTSNSDIIKENVYWLSTVMDVIDWNHSHWYITPCKSWADFTGLMKLSANTNFSWKQTTTSSGNEYISKVELNNVGPGIQFAARARVIKQGTGKDSGDNVLPIWWDDNFVTLFPGQKITIEGRYRKADVGTNNVPVVVVDSWNSDVV